MQQALGSLLLEAVPKPTKLNRADQQKRLDTKTAWSVVLDGFPADAFSPTLPIENEGNPWLFLLMEETSHQAHSAYDLMAQRYGPEVISEPRNRQGQTLLEAVYAECLDRLKKPTESHGSKAPVSLLSQTMSLVPLAALALSEDGDSPAGSTWLARVLSLKGANLPDDYSVKIRPEEILLQRGANPNHLHQGAPVGALIQKEKSLEILLKHGLDLTANSNNPISPEENLGELLTARSDDLAKIVRDRLGEVEAKAVHPMAEAYRLLAASSNKAIALGRLTQIPNWETAESPAGVPAIWVALNAVPAVLTDLRKPKLEAKTKIALTRRDTSGRSPWVHFFTQMGGEDKPFGNFSNSGWALSLISQGFDTTKSEDILTPEGEGLYAQAFGLVERTRDKNDFSSFGHSHSDPQRIPMYRLDTTLDTLYPNLKSASHEAWWGTPEAQQKLGQKLIRDFANRLRAAPIDGEFPSLSVEKLKGDLNQLHPELVGALRLIEYAHRVRNSYGPNLSQPISDENGRLAATGIKPEVHNEEALNIIRKVGMERIVAKGLTVPAQPSSANKKGTGPTKASLDAARNHWAITQTMWRELTTQCHVLGPNQPGMQAKAEQRVRVKIRS